MTSAHTLDAISSGDLSAAVAQRVIATTLRSNSEGAEGRVYDALRGFVYQVLTQRRGLDDDLPAWSELIRRTAVALIRRKAREGEWLQPLSDLVGDSITFAEIYRVDEIVRRAHVREILSHLRDHADAGRSTVVSREEVKTRTKLKDANLSRILSTLIVHGLVERRSNGKYMGYELTARGKSVLRCVPPAPSESARQPAFALGGGSPRPAGSATPRITDPGKPGVEVQGEAEPARAEFALEVRKPPRTTFLSRAAPKTTPKPKGKRPIRGARAGAPYHGELRRRRTRIARQRIRAEAEA